MRCWAHWLVPFEPLLRIFALGRTAMNPCKFRLVAICALAALFGTSASGQENPEEPMTARKASLPSDRVIGHIEPVFEFYDDMPTGVSVSAKGRIFINFPRWGDEVPFTVAKFVTVKSFPTPMPASTNSILKVRPKRWVAFKASSLTQPTGFGFWIPLRQNFRSQSRAPLSS
jgi:hypothetical protein